tara:strand:- start:225 stop:464 length:240 start_codon:yes stop_codon:yes gene_type:complete
MSNEDFTDDIDIIQGKSYIQKNKKVTTDLTVIKNNTLTILNHLCQSQVPEGIPPEKKGLKQNSQKNNDSIYTSIVCVHQ